MLGVAQAPAAEVTGRGRGQGEAADPRRLLPVQLAQPLRGDAPALQVGADAEGTANTVSVPASSLIVGMSRWS